jgi:hypothetical protein
VPERERVEVDASQAVPSALTDSGASAAELGRLPASTEPTVRPLLSGAWLRGRVTSAQRSSWGGYRIGLTSLDRSGDSEAWRARADRDWESIRPVALDGGFELGPFTGGSASVELFTPFELVWRDAGQGNWNRQTIGMVELVEGEVVERDFEVGEFPGELVIEVRVNGQPVAGLDIEIQRDDGHCRANGRTDAAGRFGPFPTLPGSVQVLVFDPESRWRHRYPAPIFVESGAKAHAIVQIEVATARVVFTARGSGEPLANRIVAVLDSGGFPLSWSNATDAEGAATFSLVPGAYSFALNPGNAPEFAIDSSNRSGEVEWTFQGPASGRVAL